MSDEMRHLKWVLAYEISCACAFKLLLLCKGFTTLLAKGTKVIEPSTFHLSDIT